MNCLVQTGKTSLLELNASDERGIDTVRERIKDFSRYSRTGFGDAPFGLIVLDECDQMTGPAQTALEANNGNQQPHQPLYPHLQPIKQNHRANSKPMRHIPLLKTGQASHD